MEPDNEQYRDVWIAVIRQAQRDLKDKNPAVADDAKKWLDGEGSKRDLNMVCYFVGTTPAQVRRQIALV